jgi:phosphoserine/homoserine phosphotransferase
MKIVCLDLEGVLAPEIWISVSEKTGIEKLRLTTRDIPDYHALMKMRLQILKKHGLKLRDIQEVIATLRPLEGALDFLDWLRRQCPVIILSDTFLEFADPLMEQLRRPVIFCNSLKIGPAGDITGYQLRQENGKMEAVKALQALGYKIIAAGDSYNDLAMLKAADEGILFCPPDNIAQAFPQFPVVRNHQAFQRELGKRLS